MFNVIYDATLLTNYFHKDAARSGIFVVAYNILLELQKREDVRLSLYIDPEKSGEAIRVKKILFPDLEYVFDYSKNKILVAINLWLWKTHSKLLSHLWLRKPFALGIVFTQSLLRLIIRNKYKVDFLKNADVYLSPAFKVPELIRSKTNAKIYILLHDVIPFKFAEFNNLHWGDYLRAIFNTSKSGDFFFANSECSKKDFEEIFPLVTEESCMVTPLAASESFRPIVNEREKERVRIKYKIPQDKRYVFSLCTVEPRKNLIRSVRSFIAFVKKHNIEDLIWVMGGGRWDSFVKELKKNGVVWNSKYIVRTGYIDDEDLPVLYSNAEWFVYTSQYEGFGLPPLEAMQCGCPVITSNNSSLPEVVGDAGIMIDWDSDEQHVEAYEKYYFNEELRKKNSRKGLERAKLFSWKKTVEKMVETMKKSYNGDSK